MQPKVESRDHTSRSLAARVAVSLREAAWSAAACALVAVLAYARDGDSIVAAGGVSLLQLLGIYAACAAVAGTVLGILRPFTTSWLGAAIVSVPVAWPLAFSTMLLSHDGRLTDMTVVDFGIALALAAVLGPFAVTYRRIRRRS